MLTYFYLFNFCSQGILHLEFIYSRDPPILPKLQLLVEENGEIIEVPYRDIPEVPIQGWNTYYFKDIQKLKDFGKKNTKSTGTSFLFKILRFKGELLHDFFKYYALEYQWGRHVVSPRYLNFILLLTADWAL